MSTNVTISEQKRKYYPKKFMQSKQIAFSTNVNKQTGELSDKQVQVTVYVPNGNETPFKPKACVSCKLGNDRLRLYADDFHEIERLFKEIGDFIAANKTNGNAAVQEQQKNYSEALKLRSEEIKNNKE
jgi:hypothetical protein